jgi:hypothetical protein
MNEPSEVAKALGELRDEFRKFRDIFEGNGDKLGVLAEHRIMWRAHVWLLCAASGGLGVAATVFIQRMMR